jgi:hypothetical protein
VSKDLVRRRFDTGRLDRVWTSDITYLRTAQGWLYLCVVRDGCSRRVIGWAIGEYRTDLVTAALAMAVAMRGKLAQAVIVHADRGSTPRRRSRRSLAPTISPDRLVGPGSAGTTPQPNLSGPHSKSSSTTATYGLPAQSPSLLSGTRSNGCTTSAGATRPSVWSAPSSSRTDSLRRHKPPDLCRTEQGSPQGRGRRVRLRRRLVTTGNVGAVSVEDQLDADRVAVVLAQGPLDIFANAEAMLAAVGSQ